MGAMMTFYKAIKMKLVWTVNHVIVFALILL